MVLFGTMEQFGQDKETGIDFSGKNAGWGTSFTKYIADYLAS